MVFSIFSPADSIRTRLPKRILLVLVFLLSACQPPPPQPLRLGSNVWIGYETLYLARSLGYFEHLSIRLVELPSATEVLHAFRNHTLEIAALTLDESLTLTQTENDIRIILVMDVSNGADALMARPEIKTLADIKGKKVAVENTAVGAILLDAALTSVHLSPADITMIPLTIDEHVSVYTDGQVDAVITFEPVKTLLQLQGAHILYDSSRIPNRIVDVLVTRQQVIDHRPDDLKHLLSAYFKALRFISDNPSEAAKKMAGRMSLSPEQILPLYQGITIPGKKENQHFLTGSPPPLTASIDLLTALMEQKKLLYKPVDTRTLINSTLLPVQP